MGHLGITQRVEVVEEYDERRDCLDQRWAELVESMGHVPIPLPNLVDDPAAYLEGLAIDGLVLTGGNDLNHLADAENVAPERDEFETAALEYALDEELPVLAVCRGVQLLNVHFGGSIDRVEDHVARDHRVLFESEVDFAPDEPITVNSYHGYGIESEDVAEPLETIAVAEDGSVEGLAVPDRPIVGVMWHPERDSPSAAVDRQLFERLFGGPY